MNLIKGWIGLLSFQEKMVWIKRHFPFKTPFTYLLEIRVKITSWNVYVINSLKNRCAIIKGFYIWSNTFWKMFNWPIFFHEILGNMSIAIVYQTGSDAMNFETSLIFLIKPSTWTKSHIKNWNTLRMKRAFKMK